MVEQGAVAESRLDEMIMRIMAPFYFFDQDQEDYPALDASLPFSQRAQANILEYFPTSLPPARDVQGDHSKLIRQIGAEATVLLKNVNSALPLRQPQLIGVFGNDAADSPEGLVLGGDAFEIGTLSVGGGSGTGRHPYLISPLQAISAHAAENGARVQHITRNSVLAAGEFKGIFPQADVCLDFLNTFAAEGHDRTSFEPDWNSTLVVENVAKRCPNTVVVTHSAGPNVLPWSSNPNVTAIPAAHLPGQDSGTAIVDVLWGRVNPSGKLPYSVAYEPEDYHIPVTTLSLEQMSHPNAWQANFSEGLLIDYRHFDTKCIEPMYEFGFGLSYTTFRRDTALDFHLNWENLSARPASSEPVPGGNPLLWEEITTIAVRIRNTGDISGSTVAQLYLSFPEGETPSVTPKQVLRGFDRVSLWPGQSGKVVFAITRRDVRYWDVDCQDWVVPKGEFTFNVGFSSRDIKTTRSFAIREAST